MPSFRLCITHRMIVAVACVLLSSMAGCEKDDDIKANAFNFDDHTTGLRSAFLFYASSPEIGNENVTPYYQNTFMLLSTGVTTDAHTTTAQGNAIELSIHSATQDLDAGTYIFTGRESPATIFEIREGRVQLDDMSTSPSSQGTQVFSFTAGQMTVTRSGRDYTIDIAGTIEGKILKAHFTGIVTILQKS